MVMAMATMRVRATRVIDSRGYTGQFPPIYFLEPQKKGPSSMSRAWLTPMKISPFLPLPRYGDAPSPPLHALSPPCAEESIDLSTLEHAASPGECSYVGRFFYFTLLAAQHRANHNAQ